MKVELFNKYVGELPLKKQIEALKRGYKIIINTNINTPWSNKNLMFIKYEKNKDIIFVYDEKNENIYKIDVSIPNDYNIKLINLPNF